MLQHGCCHRYPPRLWRLHRSLVLIQLRPSFAISQLWGVQISSALLLRSHLTLWQLIWAGSKHWRNRFPENGIWLNCTLLPRWNFGGVDLKTPFCWFDCLTRLHLGSLCIRYCHQHLLVLRRWMHFARTFLAGNLPMLQELWIFVPFRLANIPLGIPQASLIYISNMHARTQGLPCQEEWNQELSKKSLDVYSG